jgi:hypothetical protein
MTDQPLDGFDQLLQLLIERATTLSVHVEAIRELLEARGVCSAGEFSEQTAALRARWQLLPHPHEALSRGLETREYLARMRRVLDPGDDTPPEGAA